MPATGMSTSSSVISGSKSSPRATAALAVTVAVATAAVVVSPIAALLQPSAFVADAQAGCSVAGVLGAAARYALARLAVAAVRLRLASERSSREVRRPACFARTPR